MNRIEKVYKCTVKDIDGAKHFFVTFRDIHHHTQTIEVAEDIYLELEKFRKDDAKQEVSYRRHIEQLDLSDEELFSKTLKEQELTDETVIEKQCFSKLSDAIMSLPETQMRRLLLYYEYDLTYKQIANLENRSETAIKLSVSTAKEKIYKALKSFFTEK